MRDRGCGVGDPAAATARAGGSRHSCVAWFSDGWLTVAGRRPQRQGLGTAVGPYAVRSSGRDVAFVGGGALFAGRLPGRLSRLPPVRSGCWTDGSGWQSFFAVADGQLLVGASPCDLAYPNLGHSQPLFIHPVAGGRWRVLTHLPGQQPPVLAARADRLAIGVQYSTRRMDVTLLDLATGRRRRPVRLPDGVLSFSGPNRLVDAVPIDGEFPISPAYQSAGTTFGYYASGYDVRLYTDRGRMIARLGRSVRPPLVSGSHVILFDASPTLGLSIIRNDRQLTTLALVRSVA